MATERKLGRPADQRKALLRNQVSQLIWNGKIVTTLDRAKEVRSIAEKLITLAMRECDRRSPRPSSTTRLPSCMRAAS